MAKYTPTSFKDRDVTYGDRYRVQQVSGTTFTIDTDGGVQGTVNEAGTGYGQALNNNQEDGISSANNSRRSDRMNLLSDALALCEDGSLWTNFQCTDSDDTDNAYFGKSAIKSTLTASSGFLYYDAISKFSLTGYYLVYAYVKNSDLSGLGARIKVNVSGGGGDNYKSSYSTSTDYTRVGVILQPSDLTSATNIFIYTEGDGASSEEWWTDGYGLIEITASEYAEGVTALLAKFPFTYSKGQDSYTEINTLGADTVVCSGRLLSESGGLSTVNLLADDVGGCESVSGWNTSSTSLAIDSSNNLEGTNCLKITLTGSIGDINRDVLSLLDTTKHYLFTAHLKNGDLNTGIKLRIACVGDAGSIDASQHTETYYTRYGIAIEPADFDGASAVNFVIVADNTTSDFGFVDSIMINEITAEDFNSLSDRTDASGLFPKFPFHRGLGSCDGVRLKSVGKNLLNMLSPRIYPKSIGTGSLNADSYFQNEGSLKITVSSSQYGKMLPIKLEAGTTYYFSGLCDDSNGRMQIYRYATETLADSTLISSEGGFNFNGSFTTDTDLHFVVFDSGSTSSGTLNFSNLYLGTSATAYEPYKESISYTPRVLRSVPNGTRDSYRHNDGVDTQRCEEHTLVSGDITAVGNGSVNQYVLFAKNTDYKSYNTITVTSADVKFDIYGTTYSGSWDTTANRNKIMANQSTTSFQLNVDLGTYADLAAAKTALTGKKIVYELATPVVTYHPENIINGYPDGTIYHEKAVEEELVYDTGLTITNTDLLIDSLDYVYKVNTDGSETPIAISDCTPNANGLSFTISSASDGELYRFAYYYFGAGTRGLASYGYCQNSKDESEGNTEGLKELNNKVNLIKNKPEVGRWELYSSSTLTVASAQVDVTIPAYAEESKIVVIDCRSDSASDTSLVVTCNSDTGANYGYNGTAGYSNITLPSGIVARSDFERTPYFEMQFANRNTYSYKQILFNGSYYPTRIATAGYYDSASKISTVSFAPSANNLGIGVTFLLYVRRVIL